MNVSAPPTTHEDRARDATAAAPLRGRRLFVARLVWLVVAASYICAFVAAVPVRYTRLSNLTTAALEVGQVSSETSRWTAETLRAALGQLDLSTDFYAAYIAGLDAARVVLFVAVAAVIFWRKSDEWLGLFVSLLLVAFGVASGVDLLDLAAAYPALAVSLQVFEFPVWPAFILLFFIFPNGRFVPRWTRVVAPALVVVLLLDTVVTLPDAILIIAILGAWLAAIVAQVHRYRRVSGPLERQQTKWIMFSVAVIFVSLIGVWVVVPALFPALSQPGTTKLLSNLVGAAVYLLVYLLIPLSIGIAILRYRLWDIDIIINRTLVYSLLSFTLGLVYVGCILISRTFVAPLTGGSELTIVASTLAIAALFTPLRRRIQNVIDKRFYRRKYDAAKVLAAFGATARDETNLDALTAELVRVVGETIQPEFIGLWLRDPQARSTTEATQPDSRPLR
jgi:hypothetical protein